MIAFKPTLKQINATAPSIQVFWAFFCFWNFSNFVFFLKDYFKMFFNPPRSSSKASPSSKTGCFLGIRMARVGPRGRSRSSWRVGVFGKLSIMEFFSAKKWFLNFSLNFSPTKFKIFHFSGFLPVGDEGTEWADEVSELWLGFWLVCDFWII